MAKTLAYDDHKLDCIEVAMKALRRMPKSKVPLGTKPNSIVSQVVAPNGCVMIIDLDDLANLVRYVCQDKDLVLTASMLSRLFGVSEYSVLSFLHPDSESYIPDFPNNVGIGRMGDDVTVYWLARDVVSYCQSLLQDASHQTAKPQAGKAVRHVQRVPDLKKRKPKMSAIQGMQKMTNGGGHE